MLPAAVIRQVRRLQCADNQSWHFLILQLLTNASDAAQLFPSHNILWV